MENKSYKTIKKFYIILVVLTAFGAVAGALYYVNLSDLPDNINKYVEGFTDMADKGMDKYAVMLGSLKASLIITAAFVVCAWMKPGAAIVCLLTARQGFIYGFTNAAFIGTIGQKGLFIALIRIPAVFFMLSAVHMLGAASGGLALSQEGTLKNLKFFLIILLISVTTFCAAAVYEGFFATTFMNIALKWFT